MKNISVIFLIVQIWISLQFAEVNAYDPFRGANGAPIIEPFDPFITVEVNTDKTIECKAERPVTWISEILKSRDGNVNVINFVDTEYEVDSKNAYKSNLEFQSITTEYVGKYYCVYNNSIKDETNTNFEDEVEKYKASSIYIFVDDPDNLLVENHEHNMIIGLQYEPFVIPCKPTSPKVKVELIKEDGEVTEISYNETIGFRVVSDTDITGIARCKFTRNETTKLLELMFEVDPLTNYLPPPMITSNSNFFATNGNDFLLTCHIEVNSAVLYTASFTHNGQVLKSNDYLTVSELQHETNNRHKAHLNLTVRQSNEERDNGDYKCTIMDYYNNTNSKIETMTFVTEPVIELHPVNHEIRTERGKKQAQFLIDYKAYPSKAFFLFNPKNEQISSDTDVMDRTKYDVVITEETFKFKVKYPDLNDYGNYTLVATTVGRNFTTSVKLIVSDKPTVSMEDVYVMAGEEVHMVCKVLAYPQADITWSFQPCQDLSLWPSCRKERIHTQRLERFEVEIEPQQDILDHDEAVESQQRSEIGQVSDIKFIPSQPGSVKCKARNRLGSDNALGQVKLGDLTRPFMVSGLKEEQKIADGDVVKLECGAIIYNYSSNIVWRKNGEAIENIGNLVVEETNTKFSWRKTITWKQISKEDDGIYECEVYSKDSDEISESLQVAIAVHDTQIPIISSNFNQSVMQQSLGDSLKLDCLVSGLPVPQLLWYKNDEIFNIDEVHSDDNSLQRIMIDNANTSITFSVLRLEDAATYKCVAWNRVGEDFKTVQLEIPTPIANLNKGIVIGIISIMLILVFLSVYLCTRVRREKKLIAELKAAGLANFEEGNLESIDPDVNLDEQADLLPYNKDYEFPRDKLKLGKQLGAGAFGVVVKGVAQGIVHYEEESTVAVKMVKKQTDNEVMKALVSELKIMIHLGKHLNVVNLLGAVTKNIAKRELMVIVEYCQFGNLQSFLVKHRPYFVDQIRDDKIDPMIAKNDLRWSKHSAYNPINSQGLKYISVTFANDKVTPKNHNYINVDANHYINCSDGNTYTAQPAAPKGAVNPSAHLNSQGYVRHSGFQNTQVDSCNTEATTVYIGQGEDSIMLSNNSEQPLWRSNYGMDYKGPWRTVNTSDLVCWSFQVARGMDYLASRKVLHGDLAARNILLCNDNIVKICDFGLARSMYKNDNYKKKGEAPLPFKWLALESIQDHVFSTYSDVWAFGVVLWELFTLGKVPYTGMEANQNLFYKLRDGYRMEKPSFANQDIYDIMLKCWNTKPESRPLFGELERILSSYLQDSVKEHYVDLNEQYVLANVNDYQKGRPDYLSQFSVPQYDAPKPPLAQEENFYVNNSIDPNNPPTSADYLSMSPKSGAVRYNPNSAHKSDYIRPDSPTITKNLDTNISPKNRAKHPNKKPELPEEIPMLQRNENGALMQHPDSDDDQHPNGYTEMSFSNGQSKPIITSDAEYKNIFDSSDNYVNVPGNSNKSIVNNPSYITFNKERMN